LKKVVLFIFDNSYNYNAFANNALVVLRMNMKDDGKQPLLHNSRIPDSLSHIIIFTDINNIIKFKSIRWILEEYSL